MIQKVQINDNKKLPGKQYIASLETFANGKTYCFQPGINIIVGENGCGKSTLLHLIENYTFCHRSMYSSIPHNVLDFPPLFQDQFLCDGPFCDGASVVCDYAGVVYRYKPISEMDKNEALNSAESFGLLLDNVVSSTGESMLNALDTMFGLAFSNKNVQFPVSELVALGKRSNDTWKERIGSILEYYRGNHLDIDGKDFQFTFLIDEPDRNLDIKNIDTIYDILSTQKEMTQIIAVIHNPILIYKLSKLPYINFIEMTDGYLEQVRKVFKNL